MSFRAPEIDLHPQALPGKGPEQALAACRRFLEAAQEAGHADARVITGLGLHGDGTPRMRQRVEREVLSAMSMRIQGYRYEQGGAVIVVEFKRAPAKPSARHLRALSQQAALQEKIKREEKLLVAWDRLDAAWESLDRGDLRRAKLKANQLSRDFTPQADACPQDAQKIDARLRLIENLLQKES